MVKLHDMFAQARRGQSNTGMGFLGKGRAEVKPRSTAIVVEFSHATAGGAEAVLKAGADGLLFHWDGKDQTILESLKKEIESVKGSNEQLVSGLRLTGNLSHINHETLIQMKEQGFQYIVLPFDAPARLLSQETKDLERVVVIPARTDELYPLYIRSLSMLDRIAAVQLDFVFKKNAGTLSIEEVLMYRAIREAAHSSSFLTIPSILSEDDAYTLHQLGIQAFILSSDATGEQIKNIRTVLEKVYQEEGNKEKEGLSIPNMSRR
jgi:hypothetical protein